MRRCDRKSSNARGQKRRYSKAKPSFSWRSTRFLASYGALCPMGTSIISTNVGGNTPASRSERRGGGAGKGQSIPKTARGSWENGGSRSVSASQGGAKRAYRGFEGEKRGLL